MKNLKKFENWEGRNPAEEGERAAKQEAYNRRLNMIDFIKYAMAGDKLEAFVESLDDEQLTNLHEWVKAFDKR